MYSSAVPSSPPPQWNPGNAPILERTRTPTSPPPTSPTSPTRPGRLRGLSYLRNYTQNHILSRDNHSGSSSHQRPSTVRASSYPSPTSSRSSPTPQNTAPPQTSAPAQRTASEVPSARINNQETPGSTSGWLPATVSSSAVLSGNGPSVAPSDLTASMVRTRSATMGGAAELPHGDGAEPAHQVNGTNGTQGMAHQLPSIRFSAHQDPRAQRPSLVFSPMSRILPTGSEIIKVGRYSERDNQPVQAVNVPSAAPVGFKSKVVSRRHCEFWCAGGRWFIKDVKSSSGTFLNHIRLSSPGTESRPFPVNDGDIVQLGIDFKGGEEMIFRCVKIRVELNKGWQTGPSSFNVQSHKRLRELNSLGKPPAGGTSSQDCSICLGPIAPCQSLFVAPCSHTWHYKCIRVIINGPHWPHFICPNCRTVADLEAELDDPYANGEWEELDAAEVQGAAEQAPPEAVAANATARSERQNNSGEAKAVADADGGASSRSHHDSSDGEIVDEKDGSGHDHAVDQAAEDLGYLNLEEGSPSPAESIDLHPAQTSNATVAPVDIIARKPVPSASNSASRLEQPESRLDRTVTRTPSPNGLGSSLAAEAGVEGPMTPRNDAGPFIFDGSAGRPSDLRLASMATMNLNAAANTPPPHVEGETA